LWCETWCDDGSKKKAKTIDLCNNPKTKEPKLTAARRILPEWEGYDNEIKRFMDNFYAKKRAGEQIIAPELHQTSADTKRKSTSSSDGTKTLPPGLQENQYTPPLKTEL